MLPASLGAEEISQDQPLPAAQAAATMRVPEGFRATLFAGEPAVRQPIGFCLDDRGRLWVAEAYNYPNHGARPGDRIVILEDTDGDGRHDKRTVFYDQLNYVTGIEYGFGGVWVMSPPNFYFIPDADRDDVPDGPPQVLLDGFGNHANAHNLANGFAWGPDGWLYGTHGRTNWSMIGKPGTPPSERVRFDGGVYRYHPIRHEWEPYADGTTNPWGIDWNDWGHAFVCNCVNPHLFQVIQGAHYEPWRGRQSSEFAYQRIDTIADHLHFVGLGNVRNGLGSPAENLAGGGHAHCGTMVYLGDQFPPRYRNQIFMHNIHGRRINNDVLRRAGSGYRASHGPDFAVSADPWYMGVTLSYGPHGEVYSSDWSDTGECHSVRNTRRQTGRIFRITYRQHDLDPVALHDRSDAELVRLQLHDNDWWVRHARRLLQERFAAGADMQAAREQLRRLFAEASAVPKKLRAMWALHAIQGWSEEDLAALLDPAGTHHEAIQGWAVQLLCEQGTPTAETLRRLAATASTNESPLVRLYLSSALQRIDPPRRWQLAEALAARGEDADDQNLPLMVWYGIEPLIADDWQRYVDLATRTALPRVRTNIARRVASSSWADRGLARLFGAMADQRRVTPEEADELLVGILEGLEGRRRMPMPAGWRAVYERIFREEAPALRARATRLALLFEDEAALATFRRRVQDPQTPVGQRREAMEALLESRVEGTGEILLQWLQEPPLRATALRGLGQQPVAGAAAAILQVYDALPRDQQQLALQTLASRPAWADRLLTAVERGAIAAEHLTAYTARQLRALGEDPLTERLQAVWGEVRQTSAARRRRIAQLTGWLTPAALQQANLVRGKQLFREQCAGCHRLFGDGGTVGPDLTGAQRQNLAYLLENMVDPSAAVAKDYQMHVVQTVDGRVLSGLIASESAETLTLLTVNDRFVLPQEEILERQPSDVSMMPEGLLAPLSDEQIRDLLGYLQRAKPAAGFK